MKIGHASIDENGKISGGKMGDQTQKEICIREWYDHPYNVYLESPDSKIAEKAAQIMEQICIDNDFGYDQVTRTTGYESIIANKYKVKGARGNFDCSSLVSTCYRLAGVPISVNNTTRSLKSNLVVLGFKAYTDYCHISCTKQAKRGGIYLSEGHHVVMVLG